MLDRQEWIVPKQFLFVYILRWTDKDIRRMDDDTRQA